MSNFVLKLADDRRFEKKIPILREKIRILEKITHFENPILSIFVSVMACGSTCSHGHGKASLVLGFSTRHMSVLNMYFVNLFFWIFPFVFYALPFAM